MMLRDLYLDYKSTPRVVKPYKLNCYRRAFGHFLSTLWSVISAPLIYPIWYIFRERITMKLVNEDVYGADMNAFWRWVWTYGDLHDPLGRGGMPLDYRNGENSFINRFWYSAIRNPRFTYNFKYYITKPVQWINTPNIDTRNFENMISSYGIGDSPDGKLLQWFGGSLYWYFIYENNTKESIYYFGWVDEKKVGKQCRFEMAHRNRK